MKKMRNIAIVSGVAVLLQLVVALMPAILYMWAGFRAESLRVQLGAAAVGIIGSADGPTSILVVGGPSWYDTLFFAACLLTFILSTVLYLRKKKQQSGTEQ